MCIALVLFVQIRSGLHRRVGLMLGMPRSKDPEKFLLDFLVGQRVVAHVPEDVCKIPIGKQGCYDVMMSENQTDLEKVGVVTTGDGKGDTLFNLASPFSTRALRI